MAPLKSVPCLINHALMGSFSDPTFTLQVSFLDIQGPYSYLVTTGASIFIFIFIFLSKVPSDHPVKPGPPVPAGKRWGRRGTAPPPRPPLPPASVDQDSPLYSLWDKAPATTRGMGILQGSGGRSAFGQPAPEREGLGVGESLGCS